MLYRLGSGSTDFTIPMVLLEVGKSKTKLGYVKFANNQVYVKTSLDPKASKSGWTYWMTVPQAKLLGIHEGDVVPVSGGKPPPADSLNKKDASPTQQAQPSSEEEPAQASPPSPAPPYEPKGAPAKDLEPIPSKKVSVPLKEVFKGKSLKFFQTLPDSNPLRLDGAGLTYSQQLTVNNALQALAASGEFADDFERDAIQDLLTTQNVSDAKKKFITDVEFVPGEDDASIQKLNDGFDGLISNLKKANVLTTYTSAKGTGVVFSMHPDTSDAVSKVSSYNHGPGVVPNAWAIRALLTTGETAAARQMLMTKFGSSPDEAMQLVSKAVEQVATVYPNAKMAKHPESKRMIFGWTSADEPAEPEAYVEPKKDPEVQAKPIKKVEPALTTVSPIKSPSETGVAQQMVEKVPIGTTKFYSTKPGMLPDQVMIKVSSDPAASNTGWKHLMSVDAAEYLGIKHDDVLSFAVSATGQIKLNMDEHGDVQKIEPQQVKPAPEPEPVQKVVSPEKKPEKSVEPIASVEEPEAEEEPEKEPEKSEPTNVLEVPEVVDPVVLKALASHNFADFSTAGKIIKLLSVHKKLPYEAIVSCKGLSPYIIDDALIFLKKHGFVSYNPSNTGEVTYSLTSEFLDKGSVDVDPVKYAPPVDPSTGVPLTFNPPSYVIPESESSLTYQASGASLGGAGEKHLYADSSGQQWLFKVAETKGGGQSKPFAAHAQAAFSKIAQQVKPGSLPIRAMSIGGRFGTIQPFASTDGNLDNKPDPSKLSRHMKEDVAAEHILDWLFSQHDSYGGNLIRTSDGRILGVDKEQCYRFFGTDKLSTTYNPNPIAPYYNKFWSGWANGDFNFNPKVLGRYIDRIEAISDDDHKKALKAYVDSLWGSKPEEADKFYTEALERKHNTRSDWEGFLTDLYKTRTGVQEGEFTFEHGWKPGMPDVPKVSKKMFTYTAYQVASDMNVQVKPSWVPKGAGTPDTSIRSIRTTGDKMHLINFAIKMGLTPLVDPKFGDQDANGVQVGSNYKWMFFHGDTFDKASIQDVKTFTQEAIPSHPGMPKYMPVLHEHPEAHINTHELANLDNMTLGQSGTRFSSDGGAVESQVLRVSKYEDPSGTPFYLFHFKLRRPEWEKYAYSGGTAEYPFYDGTYDEKKDAIVLTDYSKRHAPTRRWVTGKSEVHICTSTKHWALMGSVYAKIVPKPGQLPVEAFREAMSAVNPNLANRVLSPPTEEERDLQKMMKVFWAAAPQAHDKLINDPLKITVPNLKKELKKVGWDADRLNTLQEREVYPGYSTWVSPGRWKNMNVAFVCEAARNVKGMVGCLKNYLAGAHERQLIGVGSQAGQSVDDDLANGSGDGILACVVPKTNEALSKTSGGFNSWSQYASCQLIFTPDLTDRMDTYMHLGDMFGCARPDDPSSQLSDAWVNRIPVEDRVAGLNNYYRQNEINFRKGISHDKLARVVADSENVRKEIIELARKEGVFQVNGVPIEDFVIVAKTGQEIYDRCIKPLGY